MTDTYDPDDNSRKSYALCLKTMRANLLKSQRRALSTSLRKERKSSLMSERMKSDSGDGR